jgi:hypothetical protein
MGKKYEHEVSVKSDYLFIFPALIKGKSSLANGTNKPVKARTLSD